MPACKNGLKMQTWQLADISHASMQIWVEIASLRIRPTFACWHARKDRICKCTHLEAINDISHASMQEWVETAGLPIWLIFRMPACKNGWKLQCCKVGYSACAHAKNGAGRHAMLARQTEDLANIILGSVERSLASLHFPVYKKALTC
jgi:hypothetical protein